MSKQQMVALIREHNRTAEADFLMRFEPRVLESYLRRLTLIHNQRGRTSVWVREGDTPAVVARVA
jgi:hypothetical protein